MNDDRKFLAKQEPLTALLNLGMPNRLIEGYFNLSQATIFNYIKKLNKKGLWTKGGLSVYEARPAMLLLLAMAKNRPVDYKRLIGDSLEGLRLVELLQTYLEADEIIKVLDYSSYHISDLENFGFSPDVPQGYQDFFRALYYREPRVWGRCLWNKYLSDIDKGDIPLPTSQKLSGDYWAIINPILSEFTLGARREMLPVLDVTICEQVYRRILTGDFISPKSAKIVMHYYGLNQEKLDPGAIAEKFDLKLRQVFEIKKKTMKTIRNNYANLLAMPIPLSLEGVFHMVEYQLTMVKNELRVLGKHPIKEMGLSTRAVNALGCADIEFMEQLTEISLHDLYRFRYIGKKTVSELEDALKTLGLSLKP